MIKKLSILLDAWFPRISRPENGARVNGSPREQKRLQSVFEVIRPYAKSVEGGVSLPPELQGACKATRFRKER